MSHPCRVKCRLAHSPDDIQLESKISWLGQGICLQWQLVATDHLISGGTVFTVRWLSSWLAHYIASTSSRR